MSKHDGTPIGRIWADSDMTIKAEPPMLIELTTRVLRDYGYTNADDVLRTLDGFSNGYFKIAAEEVPA